MDFASLRYEYSQRELNETDLNPMPFQQFCNWFTEAKTCNISEPNAMVLASVGPEGNPSTRVVLLKEIDSTGFIFFSHYTSRKGHELQANPHAAVLFFWPELERQIRIEGVIERIDAAASDAYFHSRPRESQLGAHVSPQSEVIPSRDFLETRLIEVRNQFGDGPIPRPSHWGGMRLCPHSFEFWQGRPNRLHDRLRYRKSADQWIIERLGP